MKRFLLVCTSVAAMSACADTTNPVGESSASMSAVLSTTAVATDLGTLGGASSVANDINILGTVVGWSQTASGDQHAFRWTPKAGMVDLRTLPGHQWSRAMSITATGQIFGESGRTGGLGTPVVWNAHGSRTTLPIPLPASASYRELADMNEFGQVVGSTNSASSSNPHAWTWDRLFGFLDINKQIPGGFESYASRINNWGQVVGTNNQADAFNNYHAYTWSRLSGYHDLGVPAGADLRRTSLAGLGGNDLGQVVGWIRGPSTGTSGVYTWSSADGFDFLPGWDPAVGGAGMGLNLLGTTVGNAWDGSRLVAAAWPASGTIVALSPGQSGVASSINDVGTIAGWVYADEVSGVTRATIWKIGTVSVFLTDNALARASQPAGAIPRCLADLSSMRSRSDLFKCTAGTN